MSARLLLLAALLAGCDTEIVEKTEPSTEAEAEVSCTHPGFCFGCGLGLNGKYACGLRYQLCHGRQRAIVRSAPYVFHWESEPANHLRGVRTAVVRELESCR